MKLSEALAAAGSPRSWASWILALAILLPSSLAAEEGILVLHVKDTKGKPVANVDFTPEGDGSKGTTNTLGKARIKLAPATRPGAWLTLQIFARKGGPDWVIVSPWNLRVQVPSFANETDNYVPVVLGERGSRELLENDQAVEAVAARILEKFGPRLDKSEISDEERKRVLAEQATAFGLEPEEIDKAIRAWGAKAKDPYKAGLAALYGQNYPKAAERLAESLELRKREQAEADAKVAEAAFFLGQALSKQAKYQEAATAYREALKAGGETVARLNNLGLALLEAGDPQGASFPLERSLELSEKSLGAEHPDVAKSLNSLGGLYTEQGRYKEAELLYRRSLKIFEKVLGPEHANTAMSLSNLAALHYMQGRYREAEPLYQRSLKIQEKVSGPEHLDVAIGLSNLAALYNTQGRYTEAETLYQRSLKVFEKVLGPEHPDVARIMNNLAGLYDAQGRYKEEEPLHQRSLKIFEKTLGPDHPTVAMSLNNLAEVYRAQGNYKEAEPLYLRSLGIVEKIFGPEHPNVATSLSNLAVLNNAQGRYAEAESLYQRALKIQEKVLGPEHPDVAWSLNNLAVFLFERGKVEEAENSSRRAVILAEQNLGACHPITATMLENRAVILNGQGLKHDAELLFDRVKKIQAGECRDPDQPSNPTERP